MSPRLRRPEAALFALALTAYAWFFQGGGWNAAVRFDLVRAVVERGTIRIDGYETNTGDLALRDGHYYCDKAPGLSFAAAPVYAALHPLAGEGRLRGRFVSAAAWLATIVTVAIPSALAVALLSVAARTLGASAAWAAGLALAYAFGTLAFPYSTLFYGHQLAAALLFAAFVGLLRGRDRPAAARRLAAVGALLGAAIAVEYPSLIGAAVLSAYALATVRPRARVLWIAAGAAVPLAALGMYHAAAFGSPLTLPYAFSTDRPRHQTALFGLGTPEPRLVVALLFSRYRGLFYSAPWLLLALPGLVGLWRSRWRPEAAAIAALAAAYLALNAGLSDWHGGAAAGARHLVPVLPFLALGAAGVVAGRVPRRPEAIAYGTLAAFSAGLMLAATSVHPEVPRWIGRPFEEYLLPAFADGRLSVNTAPIHTGTVHERREAWNAGEWLGLSGRATLLPLAILEAAGLAWLVLALRVSNRLNRSYHPLDRPAASDR